MKKKNKTNIKIFIKPIKKKIFTSVKAPMAHKTNSKEQYKFSFYSFTIKFNTLEKKNNFDKDNLDNLKLNSMYSNFLFI